jgi:tetratricopeptide (TPR) repeat protein
MDYAAQLHILQGADGDPARLALATVDLLLSYRSADERKKVRTALEAAAIAHWFDEKILAVLLEITEAEAVAYLVRLRELTIVEPFPARGSGVMNVHETARLSIRASLADQASERMRALSGRAHAHFALNPAPHAVVEALYHRFSVAPLDAARECSTLFERWEESGQYESLLALGNILTEVIGPDQRGLPAGSVRGATLYNLGRLRLAFPRLEDRLEKTAEIARAALTECATREDSLAASVHDLFGNVLREQNNLDAALEEYCAALEIRKRWSNSAPEDIARQRNLSSAHNKIGEILKRKGALSEALNAFRAGLAIVNRLAEQAPNDETLQRDLSLSYKNIGVAVRAQGDVPAALEAFHAAIIIAERLAKKEPKNAVWQSDLSVSHEQIGHALIGQGDLQSALVSLRAGLVIRELLASSHPTNADWQLDLAWSCGSVANVLLRLSDAQHSEALRLITRGKAIMTVLARARPLTPHEQEVRNWLDQVATKISQEPTIQ